MSETLTTAKTYRLVKPIRTTRIYHADSLIYYIRQVDNLGRRMYLFRLEDAATTWLFEGEFYEDGKGASDSETGNEG